jgi:hypothetical protein
MFSMQAPLSALHDEAGDAFLPHQLCFILCFRSTRKLCSQLAAALPIANVAAGLPPSLLNHLAVKLGDGRLVHFLLSPLACTDRHAAVVWQVEDGQVLLRIEEPSEQGA